MANTKKVDKESAPIETKKEVTNQNTTNAENEVLKAQLAELKAQMELMSQMVLNKQASVSKKKDRQITFVNLAVGTLVLRGSTIWKIEGQFNKQIFPETEASIIVANMGSLICSGGVYIDDADFVEEHNLAEIYKYILSEDKLKDLFNQKVEYVIEAYKMSNQSQKDIIVAMIEEKLGNHVPVDANILVQLGKLCGKDFMSIEKEEE